MAQRTRSFWDYYLQGKGSSIRFVPLVDGGAAVSERVQMRYSLVSVVFVLYFYSVTLPHPSFLKAVKT